MNAENLLQGEMKVSSSDPSLAPNITSYTMVLSGWAKTGCKKAAERVEEILLEIDGGKRKGGGTIRNLLRNATQSSTHTI